jgi:hypothetical protein
MPELMKHLVVWTGLLALYWLGGQALAFLWESLF